MSIDLDGTLKIDTSAAMASTPFKVLVVVGSQTIEYIFNILIKDCIPFITFPKMEAAYVSKVSEPEPKIDVLAESSLIECVIDPDSYTLNSLPQPVIGIALTSGGIFSVDMSRTY